MSKGNIDAFLRKLFMREAGGDTKVINSAGYIGKYQFGEAALIDLGYYRPDGNNYRNDWVGSWTGKHGITSRSQFLNSEAAQDTAAHEWVALLCKKMKHYKLNEYIGKTVNGVKITESGIIAGAHLKGFGSDANPGVRQFLKSNGAIDPRDGLGTKVSHYVELMADYELGCCTAVAAVFAEKETRNPIAGLDVQVMKNGKPHTRTKTDQNGTIPPVHGFSIGDRYEILVAKLTGGFKALKAGLVHDSNVNLAFLSPKAAAKTTTEPHKGSPGKRPAPPAEQKPAPGKPAAASAQPAAPAAAKPPAPAAERKPAPPPAKPVEPTAKPAETASPAAPAKATTEGATAASRPEPEYSVQPVEPTELDKNASVWELLSHIDFLDAVAVSEPAGADDAAVDSTPAKADTGTAGTAAPAEAKPEQAGPAAAADKPAPVAPAKPAVPASHPAPAKPATPASQPAPAKPATPAAPPASAAKPKAPASAAAAKKPAPPSTVAVEKTRSESGHPKAVVKKTPPEPPPPIVMPMQKTIPGLLFPLEKRPEQTYTEGARRFGSGRSGGRKHGGIDLYAPVGSTVRAMADGKVIQVYLFYAGTWVIEVDHGTFIARYGEVSKASILVKAKEEVKRGQKLAGVGKLSGISFSMLHLEMYATTESPTKKGLTQKGGNVYQRRDDLINPTQSIDIAVME